jgi:hypothetical protein
MIGLYPLAKRDDWFISPAKRDDWFISPANIRIHTLSVVTDESFEHFSRIMETLLRRIRTMETLFRRIRTMKTPF